MNKQQYKVQYAVDFRGIRLEPKSIIELSGEDALLLADAVLPVASATGKVVEKDPDEMNVIELRAKCKALNLPSDGSKADMLDRIRLSAKK